MGQDFEEVRSRFRPFYDAVKLEHENAPMKNRGHGLDHDVTVGALALHIADDGHTGVLAWCAAMLHSLDRMFGRDNKSEIERAMRNLILKIGDSLSEEDKEMIFQAAVRHAELNLADQSLVQQTLMDADRLANLMPAVVIRAGQFLPEIPAFEFSHLDGLTNPESTYHEPRSVLDNLRTNLTEYMSKLRIKGAIELGTRYSRTLEAFIRSVEESNQALGLAGLQL